MLFTLRCDACRNERAEQPFSRRNSEVDDELSEVHGELYRGNTVVFTNRITGSGCKLELVTNHPKPTAKGAKNVVSELNLGDFDPRVKIDGDDDQNEYEDRLERTDAQMKTHEVMEYSDGQKLEVWTAQIDVFFDSKESADRFAKAISHAITLCGGNGAPF